MQQPILSLKNVSVDVNGSTVLSGVSFSVDKGDFTLIQGMNGEGKTVLLNAVIGKSIFTGDIQCLGRISHSLINRDLIGLSVSSYLSIYGNIASVVNTLGITYLLPYPLSDLPPSLLKMVGIAKAFIDGGDIVILDDPFSGLDKHLSDLVYSLIRGSGKTVIVASATINPMYTPNRVITLSNGKAYESNVIVKEKVPSRRVKRENTKLYIIITLILLFSITSLVNYDLLALLWVILSGGVAGTCSCTLKHSKHTLLFILLLVFLLVILKAFSVVILLNPLLLLVPLCFIILCLWKTKVLLKWVSDNTTPLWFIFLNMAILLACTTQTGLSTLLILLTPLLSKKLRGNFVINSILIGVLFSLLNHSLI